MTIYYIVRDCLFNKVFKFERGQLVLTQCWDVPVDESYTIGNLLYSFYDTLDKDKINTIGLQARVQTKTFFNCDSEIETRMICARQSFFILSLCCDVGHHS